VVLIFVVHVPEQHLFARFLDVLLFRFIGRQTFLEDSLDDYFRVETKLLSPLEVQGDDLEASVDHGDMRKGDKIGSQLLVLPELLRILLDEQVQLL
jgi:hypothetical protein